MASGVQIVLQEYSANQELTLFKYSAKTVNSIPSVETNSTLPNAAAFAKLAADLKELMVTYQKLVEQDAKVVKDYIDGLNVADKS